jgi:hypothetical protein
MVAMPCARVCRNANKLLLSVTDARYIQAMNIRQGQMLQASRHTACYPCSINQRTSTNLSRDWVIYPMMGIYLIAQILLCCRHSTCKPTAVSRCRRHLHLISAGYSSLTGWFLSVDWCSFSFKYIILRSSSMRNTDRRPLADAPAADLIWRHANNRLGAVYSALHSFWSARHAAITTGQGQQAGARRDAYSVVLFCDRITNVLVNDFTRTPDQLLDTVLVEQAYGCTDFSEALGAAQTIMEENWSTERLVV